MEIKKIISKKWQLNDRDWLVATGQAIVVAGLQAVIDQIPVFGLKFNYEQILIASLLVFLNHIVRKLTEPSKEITIKKLSDPPPLGDPTHPIEDPETDPVEDDPNGEDNPDDGDGNIPPIGDPTHPPKP